MPLPAVIFIFSEDPLDREVLETTITSLRDCAAVEGCFSYGRSKQYYYSEMFLNEHGITHLETKSVEDQIKEASKVSNEISEKIGKRPVCCLLSGKQNHTLVLQAMLRMGSPCWVLCGGGTSDHYLKQCNFWVKLSEDLSVEELENTIKTFLQSLPVIRRKTPRKVEISENTKSADDNKLADIEDVIRNGSFKGMSVSAVNFRKIASGAVLFELLDRLNDQMFKKYSLLPSVLHIDKNRQYETHFFNKMRTRWHKLILNGITARMRFVETERRKVGDYYRKQRIISLVKRGDRTQHPVSDK